MKKSFDVFQSPPESITVYVHSDLSHGERESIELGKIEFVALEMARKKGMYRKVNTFFILKYLHWHTCLFVFLPQGWKAMRNLSLQKYYGGVSGHWWTATIPIPTVPLSKGFWAPSKMQLELEGVYCLRFRLHVSPDPKVKTKSQSASPDPKAKTKLKSVFEVPTPNLPHVSRFTFPKSISKKYIFCGKLVSFRFFLA